MRACCGCHKGQRNVDTSIYLKELMTGIPHISCYIYTSIYIYIYVYAYSDINIEV